jgi:hypothetical protein
MCRCGSFAKPTNAEDSGEEDCAGDEHRCDGRIEVPLVYGGMKTESTVVLGMVRRKTAAFTLRMNPEIKSIAERAALDARLSLASLIELLLVDYCRKQGLMPKTVSLISSTDRRTYHIQHSTLINSSSSSTSNSIAKPAEPAYPRH